MLSYVLPFPVSAYHLLPLSQESMRWFRLTLVTSTIALLEASVPFAFVTIAFPLILFLVQVQRWPDGRMDGCLGPSLPPFSNCLFNPPSLLLTRIRSKPTGASRRGPDQR